MLVTDVARAACMLGMAWVVATDGPIVALVALSIVAAGLSTFFYPAIGAYIPNLAADERQLGPANSAWASLDNLGFVLGPMLGGLLVASGGTTFAFLINAATFLVIAAVLWTLPPSTNVRPARQVDAETEAVPAAVELLNGAQAASVMSRASIVPLIGIGLLRFVDYAIYGGIGVLTVVLATDILEAGAAATGSLNAAIGVGGVAGAVVSGLLVLRRSLAGPLLAGAIVLAGGSLVLGASQVLAVAFAAIVLVSAGHLVLEVVGATVVQRVTTDAVRGRAVGAMMTTDTAAEAAGSLMLPILVTSLGAPIVLGSAGVLLVAAALAALALIGPALTRPTSPFEASLARVSRLPLFAGVPGPALEAALARIIAVPVRTGDAVVTQGEPSDRFYIIESGRFAVSQTGPDGTVRELRQLGPGDVFGELGLLTEAPRSATVTAVEDGQVLALDGPDFLGLVSSGTSIRRRMLDLYEAAPALDR